jgi:glycosyltransferase involved in cell wall biosynthesis
MIKLVYISQGNIPSKWAHTFQAMKMAESFSRLVTNFRLIAQAHWTKLGKKRFDFESWYGIRNPFNIVRLPRYLVTRQALFEQVYDSKFDVIAARYASWCRPDLIYTRSPLAGKISAVRYGLPTIFESHSQTDQPVFQHVIDAIDHPCFIGLVTVTGELRNMFVKAGVPEEKILVWPDAVDLSWFENVKSSEASVSDLRRHLELPVGRPIVTYTGHLYPHKGIATVLECARKLPNVFFLVAGGWEQDIFRCKEKTKDLDNIWFTGFLSNSKIANYLAAPDILLLPNSANHPSAKYTSPLKLFEYMAARKPIISSNIEAIRSVLRHGENAWLIEPDDAYALSRSIKYVLKKKNLSSRLAETAHRDVRQYTWDRRARCIINHFMN